MMRGEGKKAEIKGTKKRLLLQASPRVSGKRNDLPFSTNNAVIASPSLQLPLAKQSSLSL